MTTSTKIRPMENQVETTPTMEQSTGGVATKSPNAIELAVIVPTYKEVENIIPLHNLLCETLAGLSWEMIVVDDDSPDGTAAHVRELSTRYPNMRAIQRVGRRGLSTAVIEGMLATSAPYMAVIDADMQHDERLLPQMLDNLKSGEFDIVVGSRHVDGGGLGQWSKDRVKMSELATKVSRLVFKSNLKDPMSGFFMITRDAFDGALRNLSGEGYKILLDIFASSPEPLRFKELPYEFKTRQFGESKVDSLVLWEYGALIADKLIGKFIPVRLFMFAAVGGTGVVIHYTVFALSFFLAGLSFMTSQIIATLVAMTTNYFFNNILTYRDKRKTGLRFFTGLASFYLICSLGIFGNVGVASMIYDQNITWWISTFAGLMIGTLWNYSASSIFIWDKK
ncbi:MAG: dolichol monophosphate mannose synthase [Hyphococcus sp.]|nr:MAG: dolichol monophosphate mannose synthase [Marinicaulis sp.]